MDVTGSNSIFYFSSDVELEVNIVSEDAVEVAGKREVIILASTLKKFFYVANKSTDKSAKLEISLI